MPSLRMMLWIAGLLLLVIFAGLFAYACNGELEVRNRFKDRPNIDFGFLPLDLLQARTQFEWRDKEKVVFKLDTGPRGEMRGTIARAAAGVGLVGVLLVVGSLFIKKKPQVEPPRMR